MNQKTKCLVVIALIGVIAITSILPYKILFDHNDRPFIWYYNGIDYTLTFEINAEEMSEYNAETTGRIPLGIDENKAKMFNSIASYRYINEHSSIIKDLTEKLNDLYGNENTNSPNYLNYVMEFIRSTISYSTDMDLYNMPDWIAYPEETLYSRAGDCEDMMILFLSIIDHSGYDSIITMYHGHTVAMVALEDYKIPIIDQYVQSYAPYDGKMYYACDPTSESTCVVGLNNEKYGNDNILCYTVHDRK